MDLLQTLQAFADLKQAEVSKKDRTKLAKQMGFSKDPLEMSLEEYAKETMKDSGNYSTWYPKPDRSLLAARMLQNLPGVGVLSPDIKTRFSNDVSPLAQQAANYYLGQPLQIDRLDWGVLGETNPGGEVLLSQRYTNPSMSMLEFLNTLAHEQMHADDRFSLRSIGMEGLAGKQDAYNKVKKTRGNYTNAQWVAIPNVEDRNKRHHEQFKNFNIEAPLFNEAKLALQNKEQIPEWMFTWQPLLLEFLNNLQKDKPKTEEQLIEDLFINKEVQ